ncbi:MAG: hypothetical protein AAGF49_09730, partial [Pseudomonadota bacterium]
MDDLLASIRRIMADDTPAEPTPRRPRPRIDDRPVPPRTRAREMPAPMEDALQRAFDPNLDAARHVLSTAQGQGHHPPAVLAPDAIDEAAANAIPAPHRMGDDEREAARNDGMAAIIPMRGPPPEHPAARADDPWDASAVAEPDLTHSAFDDAPHDLRDAEHPDDASHE